MKTTFKKVSNPVLLQKCFYALSTGAPPGETSFEKEAAAKAKAKQIKQNRANAGKRRKYSPELAKKVAAARTSLAAAIKDKTKLKWQQILADLIAQSYPPRKH